MLSVLTTIVVPGMCGSFTDYKTVFQSICSYSRGLSLIHRTPFREEETKAQRGKEVLGGAEQALVLRSILCCLGK